MGDYIFANDMDINQVQRVEVPDGDFILELYQTQKTSEAVDLIDIYLNLNVLPSTVPRRNTTHDYDYGDPREILATSSALISDINNFCWGGDQTTHNYVCDWHPSLDTMVTALGSYGISGKIVMSTGMRNTVTLASVNFCSALPNGAAGLTDPTNRKALVDLGVPCPKNRRLGRRNLVSPGSSTESESQVRANPMPLALGETGRAGLRAGGLRVTSPCFAHSDCDQTVPDPFLNHTGLFCGTITPGAAATCQYCAFCQYDSEGVDGHCLDQCGISGDFPQCMDASGLFGDGFACPSTYNFSVYRYNPPGSPPVVQPGSQPSLPEITPHNYLVGPIMITQIRSKQGPCSDVQSLPMRVFSNRTTCPSGGRDGTPYGMDPAFLSSSSIYNGKLSMAGFYDPSELKTITSTFSSGSVFSEQVPYGFFPHQYDGNTFKRKDKSLISPGDVDTFKLYFDGILTLSQANSMITYMQDGGFIDQSTQGITIQMITFNVDLNLFSAFVVFFNWEVRVPGLEDQECT